MQLARAVRRGLLWASAGIALLLGDSLSPDRKQRQKRRRTRDENPPGERGA